MVMNSSSFESSQSYLYVYNLKKAKQAVLNSTKWKNFGRVSSLYVSYSAKMTQEILVHNINKSQIGQVRTSKITSKIPY